jgi:hypothetical protein
MVHEVWPLCVDVTAGDWEAFYQIPILAHRSLPGALPEISSAILVNAMRTLQGVRLPCVRWEVWRIGRSNECPE